LEGILVPLAFFAMIAAIVVLPRYFKSLERQKMAEAVKAAIENGQPLPGEIFDAMSANVRTADLAPTPQRDLRTGIVWLGVALGLVALGLIVGFESPDATYWFLGFAAFPGFIGLAFIVLGLLNRSKL
jgi:hypothetical protein